MSEGSHCNADKSLIICSLFESEILVWLVLKNWNHPLAEDAEYRTILLETATDVLAAAASQGTHHTFIEGLAAQDMNLIAALWYAENRALEEVASTSTDELAGRVQWMENIKRTLPSCFCPIDDLPPGNPQPSDS